MEPTKYYSLSAAARDCGVSKQMIAYAYKNRKTRIVRRKEDSRFLGLNGYNYKMPHSKNKQIFFNGHEQYGTLSCSCGKVMSQSIPTGYIPPGNPGQNFFERANPGHPGKFFCLIPCSGARNDSRIPRGWGKIFPNSKKLFCIKLAKVLEKLRRLRDSKTTRKPLNRPALIFT